MVRYFHSLIRGFEFEPLKFGQYSLLQRTKSLTVRTPRYFMLEIVDYKIPHLFLIQNRNIFIIYYFIIEVYVSTTTIRPLIRISFSSKFCQEDF